jgi:GYF domain 2
MADQWYYGPGATRLGPFTAQELKDLAAAGKIQSTDTIWKEGLEQGVPATRVRNLFPQPQPVARPPTASAGAAPPAPTAVEKVNGPDDQFAPAADHNSGQGQATTSGAQGDSGGGSAGAPSALASADTVGSEGAASSPSELSGQDGSASSETGAATEASSPGVAESGQGAPSPVPEDSTVTPKNKSPVGGQPKKGRALSANGAVIVSQDGYTVYFRKKCTKCGYEDLSKSRMPIRSGTTRTGFFCPKCRKLRQVEILGVV